MQTMISCSVFILLLLVTCCPANKRFGAHYDRTPPPMSNEGKSTHISEFTDPATGLNPFLDIEEGQTGEMGRNVGEEEEVLPPPLSDSDFQPVEGGPDDRWSSPRWNEGFGRRWEHFNNKSQRIIPMLPTSDVTSTGRQGGNRFFKFPAATETNFQVPPDVFVPSTKISDSYDESDYSSHRPVEDHSLRGDYNDEHHEDEISVVQEDSAHLKKEPISKNVLISAAITGASVAVIALLLAVCWWKQKMKRGASTQGNSTVTGNDIESVISEKANTNTDIQKKSNSA